MGQHHSGSVGTQGHLYNLAHGNSRAVHSTLAHFPTAQDLAFCIQAKQKHGFHTAAKEERCQIRTAHFNGRQDHFPLAPVHQIISADLCQHTQKQGRILTDSRYFLQLLHRCFQHLGKATEMIQQIVCDGICILPGDAVKQCQLQHLHIREIIQAAAQEAFLQPLTMALMYRHGSHLKKSFFVFLFALAICHLIR